MTKKTKKPRIEILSGTASSDAEMYEALGLSLKARKLYENEIKP